MATILDSFTDRDITTLAGIVGRDDPEEFAADLRRRPWQLFDLLSDESTFDAVMDRHDHPADVVSPALLFAVLAFRASDELRGAPYMNDWAGPRSRLPVFDVHDVHEFLGDPGRIAFLVRLLVSFVAPAPLPVPAHPLDLVGIARWVDVALPSDRSILLRRLADLSLFLSGVFPDRVGAETFAPIDAARLGSTLGLSSDQVLELCLPTSLTPGLEALEALGSRWYTAVSDDPGVPTPPIVSDVARRFRSARRVLNHVSDRYLNDIDPRFPTAA